ncbi:uncharacterized protein EURHEDRAFT_412206 [Aspergillus ruber CBS 135680]|uniref:Uncharacterized protein n=1 Tax=Aspergillus ruber (strain CBS 135680) TaxID=1388766 RepID=A0A017SEJ9_ASPRC|nr:uncharacterized protein EURHEDRAFT_412206 [Aspergillus ruber CBS 135680]EYE95387.1 hypothetical protein EURHEDRAFT_412206 [Aspergillus ruber CBS 135680]
MADILNPINIFIIHPQSQRYIKTTRDETDSEENTTTTIETTFDLTFKITKASDGTPSSIEAFPPTEQPPSNEAKPRHYRIDPDYETGFITRSTSDLQPDEERDVTIEDVLKPLPESVQEQYKAWVDAYNGSYKTRVEDTGDEKASVFATAEEEVAWNVAGYLLTWRLTFAPEIGSAQYYGFGNSRSFVVGENQLPSTVGFLKAGAGVLESGKPSM